MADINILLGKTLESVTTKGYPDEVHFTTTSGEKFMQYHYQDCCENVYLEDIAGDLQDLVGSPILVAEEATNLYKEGDGGQGEESWTFYKLATVKGYVTLRWYGTSNGYYSTSVSFKKVEYLQ